MTNLMEGFPPALGGQVTLANWRNPPFSRWAFQHVRELIPSADIANDPASVWELEASDVDFSTLRIDAGDKGFLTLEAFSARRVRMGWSSSIVAARCSSTTPAQ